jgi:signal transduction histidine kinase
MSAFHSVRRRLLVVMLATTITALLVAAAAMIVYDMRVYRHALANDLKTQADVVAQSSAPALLFDDRDAARDNLAVLKAKPNIAAAALYNADGGLFALYTRSGASGQVPLAPEAEGIQVSGDEMIFVRRIGDNGSALGAVYLKGDYELVNHLASYAAIMGGVLALSLVVALVMSMWLQSTITTPIIAMREVAQQVVDTRDFSLRAAKSTDDEIGYLADAFNAMLAEIGQRTQALEQSNASLAQEIHEREIAQRALLDAEEELKRFNAQLEQRVAERTAELAAANKELESFSYSVSHDLRAPVRAIAGFSRLLAQHHEADLNGEAKRKLGIVRSEAARMGTLIDDLLAFSRLGRQPIQMSVVDMEELVRINVRTLDADPQAGKPELRIGTLPKARGDRGLLAQVWANLLANAYKFSGKSEHPAIEVNAMSDAAEHVYSVRDNGVGFDPRYASKLFGVFQRLHDPAEYPGTGVGLALVHRIIARHGGRVWAEGEPGVGATFYFSLPRKDDDGSV